MAATGRPARYEPAYCDRVVDLMAEGHSLKGTAIALRINRKTLYNWARGHPEFADSLDRGRCACTLFWENRLIAIANGGKGNTRLVIVALKNICRDDWGAK